MAAYKVVGRTAEGKTLYYTGRAGQGFVSPNEAEAFGYDTLDGARHRALNLNRMTAIHGIRFMVPHGEDELDANGMDSVTRGEIATGTE